MPQQSTNKPIPSLQTTQNQSPYQQIIQQFKHPYHVKDLLFIQNIESVYLPQFILDVNSNQIIYQYTQSNLFLEQFELISDQNEILEFAYQILDVQYISTKFKVFFYFDLKALLFQKNLIFLFSLGQINSSQKMIKDLVENVLTASTELDYKLISILNNYNGTEVNMFLEDRSSICESVFEINIHQERIILQKQLLFEDLDTEYNNLCNLLTKIFNGLCYTSTINDDQLTKFMIMQLE